ncbi:uncharacterized protein LOC143240611 [Tachypleus tridentatus]|uniref:uncharacterized protein LOC143240611 n=1 Tax=Tachypleus tridentatus TaxID=6853 RepID=UPI003FD4D68B
MRKYIQLSLVIVSFVSVCFLLFYHRQYSKMKVVVEVMNAFGVRINPSNQNQTRESLEVPSIKDSCNHSPFWTEVVQDVFVYSAFLENITAENYFTVEAVAIIRNKLSNEMLCILWYGDGKNKTVNVHLKTYSGKDEKQYPMSVLFLCKFVKPDGLYGVSFVSKELSFNKQTTIIIPITKNIKTEKNDDTSLSNVVACIPPNQDPLSLHNAYGVVEFIEYHQMLGVKRFAFYDTGSPELLWKVLQHTKLDNFSVQVMTWNIPFWVDFAANQAYLLDCVYRYQNEVQYVLTVNIDHFLVIKSDHDLSKFLFNHSKQLPWWPVYHFCNEYRDDIVARILNYPFVTLRKTKRYQKAIGKYHPLMRLDQALIEVAGKDFRSKTESIEVSNAQREDFHINVYHSCKNISAIAKNFKNSWVEDNYFLNYRKLYFSSSLYNEIQKYR